MCVSGIYLLQGATSATFVSAMLLPDVEVVSKFANCLSFADDVAVSMFLGGLVVSGIEVVSFR